MPRKHSIAGDDTSRNQAHRPTEEASPHGIPLLKHDRLHVWLDRDVFTQFFPTLTPGERQIYIALAMHVNENAMCWPSIGLLAKETGLKVRQVQYGLRGLEARGLLTTRPRRKGQSGRTSSLYTLLKPPDPTSSTFTHALECTPLVQCSAPPPCSAVHPELSSENSPQRTRSNSAGRSTKNGGTDTHTQASEGMVSRGEERPEDGEDELAPIIRMCNAAGDMGEDLKHCYDWAALCHPVITNRPLFYKRLAGMLSGTRGFLDGTWPYEEATHVIERQAERLATEMLTDQLTHQKER